MNKELLEQELAKLSKDQRKAVESKNRFLRIIAGAGAGKTRTMAMRIVYLLSLGVKPKEIVAFTFTERAAQNLKNRIYENVGKIDPTLCNFLGEMFIGTIHAFCFQMLQDHYGYGNFEVLDENQEMAFLLRQGWGLGLNNYGKYPKNCELFLNSVSAYYDEQLILESIDKEVQKSKQEDYHVINFTKNLKKYEAWLNEHKLLTFAHIISLMIHYLTKKPELLSYIKHLIVDEYQDVNKSQQDLVKLIARNTSVYIVGDPRQCIYQWRGSDNTSFDNFLKLAKDLSGKNPETVNVSDNWRSGSSIVEIANKFASTLNNKYDNMKPALPEKGSVIRIDYETNDEEADKITDYIISLVRKEKKCKFSDIALIFRSVSTSADTFIEQMRRKDIPFIVGGKIGLFKRDEAQLVGSLFAWLYNDAFWYEGKYRNTDSYQGDDILDYAEEKWLQIFDGSFPKKLIIKWKEEVKKGSYNGLTEVYQDLLLILGFLKLDQNDELEAPIMANLGRFNGLLTDYQTSILRGGRSFNWERDVKGLFWFMQNHAYGAYEEQPAEDIRGIDAVQILTVHQAKGLEWLVVFLPGLTEKRFPSSQMGKIRPWFIPRTIFPAKRYEGGDDDERRLFYVAITRARDALVLSTFEKITNAQSISPYLDDLDLKPQKQNSTLPSLTLKVSHKEDEIMTFTGGEIIEYERCGYFYRLRNLWNYQSVFSEFLGYGKSLHHALRRASEIVKAEGKDPEDAIKEVFEIEGFHLPFAKQMKKDIATRTAKEALLKYVKKYKNDVLNIKEVEARLEFPLHKSTIAGRVDVIMGEKDKIMEVRDYKTSDTVTTLDEASFQVQLYTIGINITKEKVQKGSIAYFKDKTGEPSIEKVNVTQKNLDEAKKRAELTISNIKSGDWNAKLGKHCKECDYKNICKYTNLPRSNIVK